MKTSTIPCSCLELCENGALEHPRYFPRQLITPTDLTLEHTYIRDRMRRHNRIMHGWGVVCGALVCPILKADGSGIEPWKVKVKSGYILGPYGDEIIIDCERTVDLRSTGVSGITGEPCAEPAVDPWCSEVLVERSEGPVYVAVKYKECMTRPVRVQPVGCGCDDTQCEYSRWRDGYEICILDHCPHDKKPDSVLEFKDVFEDLVNRTLPNCPPCPEEPWVGLAKVGFDAKTGIISEIDNCACRRLVLSFGHFWWQCKSSSITIGPVTSSVELVPSATSVIKIKGSGFDPHAEVKLGAGVGVKTEWKDQEHLEVTVNIDADAEPGPRTLTITNPDCSMAIKENAISIISPSLTPEASPSATPTRRPARSRRGER